MMRHYLFFLLFIPALSIYSQNEVSYYQTEKGEKHLLGSFERSDLDEEQFLEWYNMVYDSYNIADESINQVNEFYDDEVMIKIYVGTWCGDSKRELTRFLKLIDHSDITIGNIELIGLDGRSENRKQGPNREEEGLNIHRVPTFLFYKNGEEIGRIVESPTTSLETDIAQIYAGLAPKPNYQVANYLLQQFENQSIVEVDTLITKNARYLKRRAKNEGELNTLGYVLLAAGKYEQAIVVFKLNTLMFPESANTYDSLGEAYLQAGNKALAASSYIKSLQLDADNENAAKVMQQLIASKDRD